MSKLRYYNFLTSPSGKYCTLNEITNADYLVLLKFVESENYEGFFHALDHLILETVPDFSEFDLIDKVYIYIAFCLYSVKNSIIVRDKRTGDRHVALLTILNNIEAAYPKTLFSVGSRAKFEFGVPRNIYFERESNAICVDYISGLQRVNGNEVTPENRAALFEGLPVGTLISMEEKCREHFSIVADIFSGELVTPMRLDIISPSMLYAVFNIFKQDLKSFYNTLYDSVQYMQFTHDGFMNITPMETTIHMGNFIADKKAQAERDARAHSRMPAPVH